MSEAVTKSESDLPDESSSEGVAKIEASNAEVGESHNGAAAKSKSGSPDDGESHKDAAANSGSGNAEASEPNKPAAVKSDTIPAPRDSEVVTDAATPKSQRCSVIATDAGTIKIPRYSQVVRHPRVSKLEPAVERILHTLSKDESQELRRFSKGFALRAINKLTAELSGAQGKAVLEAVAKAEFNDDIVAAKKALHDRIVREAVLKSIRIFTEKKLNPKRERIVSMPVLKTRILRDLPKRRIMSESPKSTDPTHPGALATRPQSARAATPNDDIQLDYDNEEYRPGHHSGEVVLEGYLTKLATRLFSKPGGGDRKHHVNWKKRFFRLILDDGNVLLEYYADDSLQDQKGTFILKGGLVTKHCPESYYSKYNNVFQVTDGNGPRCIVKFIAYASDKHIAKKWVDHIKRCLRAVPRIRYDDD